MAEDLARCPTLGSFLSMVSSCDDHAESILTIASQGVMYFWYARVALTWAGSDDDSSCLRSVLSIMNFFDIIFLVLAVCWA